jgi:hypothetical protein
MVPEDKNLSWILENISVDCVMNQTENFTIVPEGAGYLQNGEFVIPIPCPSKTVGLSVYTLRYMKNVKDFIEKYPDRSKNHISFLEYLKNNDSNFLRYDHADISLLITQPAKKTTPEARHN